jgi:hypothetical protein
MDGVGGQDAETHAPKRVNLRKLSHGDRRTGKSQRASPIQICDLLRWDMMTIDSRTWQFGGK